MCYIFSSLCHFTVHYSSIIIWSSPLISFNLIYHLPDNLAGHHDYQIYLLSSLPSDEEPPVLPVWGKISKAALFPVPDSIFIKAILSILATLCQASRPRWSMYDCHTGGHNIKFEGAWKHLVSSVTTHRACTFLIFTRPMPQCHNNHSQMLL